MNFLKALLVLLVLWGLWTWMLASAEREVSDQAAMSCLDTLERRYGPCVEDYRSASPEPTIYAVPYPGSCLERVGVCIGAIGEMEAARLEVTREMEAARAL